MLDFLKKQLNNIEEELKQLYLNRARAGVETVGSYENMIASKKAERKRLLDEIIELEGTNTTASTANTSNNAEQIVVSKQRIRNLVANGKLNEALEAMQAQWDDSSITLLAARLSSANRDKNKGIISRVDYDLSINSIVNSILEILKDL